MSTSTQPSKPFEPKKTDGDTDNITSTQPVDQPVSQPTTPTTGPTDELVIDTSKMSEGQRAAMEVTESARESQGNAGFAGPMFLGQFDPSFLEPFPVQLPQDRTMGDELVKKVSAFLAKHLDAEKADETQTIPRHVIDGLVKLGVFKMKVPVEYGGLGLSQVNYNRVIMAISSYCGSTAVQVSAHQSIGVPQPLKMFGTPAQKEKYLPRISEGAMSAFALTEPDVGSDPARMTTTAVLSEDKTHYILNGTKLWTTNGPIADLLVVMAKTAPKMVRGKERQQISAFIVEADTPGIEVVHRCDFMGIRAIQNGLLKFTDVKVPAENLLWGEGLGLKLALKTLNTGRLTLPAACTGMAKQCVSIVRHWGKERQQWGLSIGRHEAGAEKIAYISATTFAMEAVTWLTSHWADEGRDIRVEAAMAKLFCSEAAWKIVDMTMQLRGGRGYERGASLEARGEVGYPVERMMRDCRINTIIEGTSEIMRLFLAREALDPHLRLSADVLRPGNPVGQKAKAAMGVLGHYAKWYPARWWGRLRHRSFDSHTRLARHWRAIDRSSNRLATALFHAMAVHQQKLERRQVLLGHLMEIGTELFAMAATCAYAEQLLRQQNHEGGGNAWPLADLFVRQSKRRVEDHFRALRRGDGRRQKELVSAVLDGQVKWLEQGVIPIGPQG